MRAHNWLPWLPLFVVVLALSLSIIDSQLEQGPPKPTGGNEKADLIRRCADQHQANANSSAKVRAPQQETGSNRDNEQGNDSTLLLVIFTGVAAVATATIAKFNYQLVGVTRDMVTASKLATEVAELALKIERPYILIESRQFGVTPLVTPFGRPTTWQHIIFTLDLRNYGKGVAIVSSGPVKLLLTLGVRMEMEGLDIDVVPRLPQIVARDIEKRPKTHIIGPGQSGHHWSENLDIPNETWKLILNDQLMLRVVGMIVYQDVFGRTYSTKYALIYNPHLARPGGSPRDVLWPDADRYNRFT